MLKLFLDELTTIAKVQISQIFNEECSLILEKSIKNQQIKYSEKKIIEAAEIILSNSDARSFNLISASSPFELFDEILKISLMENLLIISKSNFVPASKSLIFFAKDEPDKI